MCVLRFSSGVASAEGEMRRRPAEGVPLGLICHDAPVAAACPAGGGRPHQPVLAVLRRQRVPAAARGGGAARRRPRQQQHQRTRCHNCSRAAHPATRTEPSQHWCGVDPKQFVLLVKSTEIVSCADCQKRVSNRT